MRGPFLDFFWAVVETVITIGAVVFLTQILWAFLPFLTFGGQ